MFLCAAWHPIVEDQDLCSSASHVADYVTLGGLKESWACVRDIVWCCRICGAVVSHPHRHRHRRAILWHSESVVPAQIRYQEHLSLSGMEGAQIILLIPILAYSNLISFGWSGNHSVLYHVGRLPNQLHICACSSTSTIGLVDTYMCYVELQLPIRLHHTVPHKQSALFALATCSIYLN